MPRGAVYKHRPLPEKYDRDFLSAEFQNVQRAVPSSILRESSVNTTQQTTDRVVWMNSTAGNRTYTPVVPSAADGFPLTIKNVGTGGNLVTVVQTIDGVASPTLADGVWMTILSNGAVWRQVG